MNTLVSINATVDSLQANTSSINGSLQSIANNLDDAFNNCIALNMTQPNSINCAALDPSLFSNGLGANFFEVSIFNRSLVSLLHIIRYLILVMN